MPIRHSRVILEDSRTRTMVDEEEVVSRRTMLPAEGGGCFWAKEEAAKEGGCNRRGSDEWQILQSG